MRKFELQMKVEYLEQTIEALVESINRTVPDRDDYKIKFSESLDSPSYILGWAACLVAERLLKKLHDLKGTR